MTTPRLVFEYTHGRIQYQAALAITATWQGSSRIKLHEELGWETLSDRRICRRILQVHKIINRRTPIYLRDKLPPNRRSFLSTVFRKYIMQNK